jgi:hypothetical protein
MKKLLFATLLMITSIVAFSQEQSSPNSYFPKEEIKQIQNNQFRDYVDFRKDHQRHNFGRNQRPQFGPQTFPMFPKPERVIVKGDKVIVIFDKSDFEKLRPMVRERVMWKERPHTRPHQLFIDKFTK